MGPRKCSPRVGHGRVDAVGRTEMHVAERSAGAVRELQTRSPHITQRFITLIGVMSVSRGERPAAESQTNNQDGRAVLKRRALYSPCP